ncbi:MAG: hypothetical protein FWG14_04575 [Peptococcaceae bacterium]|nr:hypothetical protein [Peptococcaceae bacterium]
MKNTRRIISVLIAVVLVMGMFSAVAFAKGGHDWDKVKKVPLTFTVEVVWNDSAYADFKAIRPATLDFVLSGYNSFVGFDYGFTVNATKLGANWYKPSWIHTESFPGPEGFFEYCQLSDPLNLPDYYTVTANKNVGGGHWRVFIKLDVTKIKPVAPAAKVPLVPVAGF